MDDSSEKKEHLANELETLRRRVAELEEEGEERRREDVRVRVGNQLRDAVWRMRRADEITSVVQTLENGLKELGIAFQDCGINLVDRHDVPPTVFSLRLRSEGWRKAEAERGADIVLQIWRGGEVVYRRDLEAEDGYQERVSIEGIFAKRVRSVVDVPFAHGTLAVNSAHPDTFSAEDIADMEHLAEVLEEGFRRMDDLRSLEHRNQDLEAQERLLTAFHQIVQTVLETLDSDEILDRLATQIIEAGLFRSLMIALVHAEERIVEVARNYVCLKGSWDAEGQVTPGRFIQASDRVVLMRAGRNVATQQKITGTTYSLDDDNITPTVARTGRLEVIEEWSERFDHNAGDAQGRKGKVAYFIPVKKGEQVLAVLATGSEIAEKKETLRRIEMMQPLLDYVGIAMDHARLYGQLQREIDERRQMEQELVRLERLRAVGELSAGISHNLNNILTSVLGPAQMLKQLSGDPEVLSEADEIIASACRARDLVHRLHLSVRGAEEELGPVRVDEVVLEAVQATRPQWKEQSEARGIAVEIVTQLEEVTPVRGTSTGLYDALINLISNAVDAMRQGGIIRIRARMAGEEVTLEVTDTGTGMDEETRRRVFEPFFTTKMNVGTGLGLSMAYQTVAGWGGDMRVESAPGKGTTFTLQLPVWDTADSRSAPARAD